MDNQTASLPDDPIELAALMDAAAAKFASAQFSAVTEDGLVSVAEVMESARRRLDGADAALLVEISDRNVCRKVGLFSAHQFLAQHLRVGDGEARRRRSAAAAIGRFSALSGGTLDPQFPATADAVADGAIGGAHVREIASVMDRIPSAVDADTRARAEAQLACVARDLTPNGVAVAGHRLLAHLDPDGQLTDDRDRARLRGFSLMPQDRQLLSRVRAQLTPELRANMEVLLEQWAAPGMNNPDDDLSPRGAADAADKTALTAAAERDSRSAAQRNHDAVLAILQTAHSASGVGGSLTGDLVITVTEAELAAGAGVATTVTGTSVPVTDLVRMASRLRPHLGVFDEATGRPLWLGRGRRLASKDQRLMLFGRDRGCTHPECSAPFARTEAHHINEWRDGGATDIDNLAAACGRHNRSVGPADGQWETAIVMDGPHAGRVAWRPVSANPDREWRVNQIHHAELLPQQGPHGPPAPKAPRGQAHSAHPLTA